MANNIIKKLINNRINKLNLISKNKSLFLRFLQVTILYNALSKIKNASNPNNAHSTVDVPYSGFLLECLDLMKKDGWIQELEVYNHTDAIRKIRVYLNPRGAIRYLKFVSTPGRRIYRKSHEIGSFHNSLGSIFISTNQGVKTDKEAKKLGLGGEVLFKISAINSH